MKTVKFFLGAMTLAVVSMVAAPAVNAQENKDAEGNTIRHPYLTNGLWDNWFVNVNPVGLNLFVDNGETSTGYAIDVNVGKWVTPSVGLRWFQRYHRYGRKVWLHPWRRNVEHL